jgi:hypothetical protein
MSESTNSTLEIDQSWPMHILSHYVHVDNGVKRKKNRVAKKFTIFKLFSGLINAPELS